MSAITTMMLLTDFPAAVASGTWWQFLLGLVPLLLFIALGLWLCYRG